MTIKSKVAAVAFTLMIASPALAQTGAAVTTNAGIAPVQAQTGINTKIDGKIDGGKSSDAIKSDSGMQAGVVQTQPVAAPAGNVPPAVIGGDVKAEGKVEHKDLHGKMIKELPAKDASKELNKDATIKTDSQAVVK